MAVLMTDAEIEKYREKYSKPDKTIRPIFRPRPFRYICPFCNGFAFRSKNKRIFEEIKCTNCSKIITDCDMERYRSYEH